MLKGVFAKNERGYRLNVIKKLLILLLSVASIRRNLLTNLAPIQIQKIATYDLDRKKIQIISNKYPLSFFANTPFKSILFLFKKKWKNANYWF